MIERFIWTEHAERRCRRRSLDRTDIERAIQAEHDIPRINHGPADWMVAGLTADGRRFVAVYDHPDHWDLQTARIVSVWEV